MPAVKGVGEPCAGEPHARIDVAAGGNRKPVGPARAARNQAPPADPPVWRTVALTLANRALRNLEGLLRPGLAGRADPSDLRRMRARAMPGLTAESVPSVAEHRGSRR